MSSIFSSASFLISNSKPYELSSSSSSSSITAPKSQPRKPVPAISLLQLCIDYKELLQVQAILLKTSLINEKHAFGRLLSSFASLRDSYGLDHAQKLFNLADIPRNSFMYNTLMRAQSPKTAFLLYSDMVSEYDPIVSPDDYTFTFVFSACAKFHGVSEGKQAHAQMVKSPVKFGVHSWNSLMDFYVKIGEPGNVARQLFDRIESPDVVSWNCLIDGYVKSGELKTARQLFDEMPQRDVVSWTTMLAAYVNAGLLSYASDLFEEMPERNLFSWTAMINGYIQMGCYSKALDVLKQMQSAKLPMDKVAITTLLSACAGLGALEQGCWLHMYVEKQRIKVDAYLSTALIDMYSKCGRIDMARKVFKETLDKKVSVWNSMLGGLGTHSFGQEAVKLFKKMAKDDRVDPNEITYINILAACNHSGLVHDGFRIFNRLLKDPRVKPSIEHYVCLIGLLGRAGLVQDAVGMISTMPMKADGAIWRALLSNTCRSHRNAELVEEIETILMEIEPLNHTNYVLVSNAYALVNRWEAVGKLRKEMKVKGLVKTPGCSSIVVDGGVHEFVAGDDLNSQTKPISELLCSMANHMKHDRFRDL